MYPHRLTLQLSLFLIHLICLQFDVLGQQRKPPTGGRIAVVVDERLSALRATPQLNGKLVRRIVAHLQFTNARLSSDGRLLLTWIDRSEGDVALKLWTSDGELLDSLSTEDIEDAWFSSDGKGIFAVAKKQQKFWSMDLDQLLQSGCSSLRLYLANPTMIKDAAICG